MNIAMMIDIETNSTANNAVIVSIGACLFHLTSGKILKTFYTNVDRKSCLDAGLVEDEKTLAWWARQSYEAKKALKDDPLPLVQACLAFQSWKREHSPVGTNLWAKPPTFDMVICKNAFNAVDVTFPFHFTQYRDMYTKLDNVPTGLLKGKMDGVAHNALHDAVHQAKKVAIANQYWNGKIK